MMKTFLKKIKTFFALSLAITVIACGPGSNKGSNGDQLSGEIKIDGSSTVYPVTEAIAEEFRTVQPKIRVTVGISGTGGGFKKFSRGETDINNASRTIKQSEIEACRENNVDYVELMIAYDGLAVIANPENDWLEEITVEELERLWEPDAQGKITKWNQIRPEWPDKEIRLFGPGVASGTYDYFTEAIVGESGASRGDFTASEDDNVLVQGIASDKYALGFFGLAYFEENAEKLKLVKVNNGENAVYPTLETVSNGTYAPLSRPVFIYITEKAARQAHIAAFVHFYLSAGAELVKDVGYVPLPDTMYDMESEKFKAFIE